MPLMHAAKLYFVKTSLMLQSSRCNFIAAPQSPLRQHSYRATLCFGTMHAGPAIQPFPPISITHAGMCAEAENTAILPSTRLMIESRRPVLWDASVI